LVWKGYDTNSGMEKEEVTSLGIGVPGNGEQAFGFINPSQVIRAVHLIPAFKWGKVTTLLPKSAVARGLSDAVHDWQLYYISM